MKPPPSARSVLIAVLGSIFIFSGACSGEHGNPNLTPLMKAAAKNDLHGVLKLIAKGADVHQRTKEGETALYEAIEHRRYNEDNLAVVEALLKAGADPNEVETYGMSALLVSLTRDYGNPEVTLLLIRAGARVPRTCGNGDSVLSLATQESSPEVMRALIGAGAQPNCQDSRGQTALFWASLNGQADRVEILLQAGADPTVRTSDGKTLVDIATTTSREKRVQIQFEKTRKLLTDAARKSSENSPGTRR